MAEMPGVTAEDINLTFEDQRLVIQARVEPRKFMKALDLTRAYTPDQVTVKAHNGVVEIRHSEQLSIAV